MRVLGLLLILALLGVGCELLPTKVKYRYVPSVPDTVFLPDSCDRPWGHCKD